MATTCVLLQYGDDPFRHRFEDLEGRAAFSMYQAGQTPNLVTRITRQAEWSQQHPGIMGPDNSFLYFGPETSIGFIMYGNNRTQIGMNFLLRPGKKEGSVSRYFITQSGKELKWRVGSHRMECVDGRTTLATWDVSPATDEHYARLVIRPAGLHIVTEIITTLALNRMARALGW
ncbi:hypothetical protein K443DRAFT_109862 [Laccaria amethystina LaAM-08-1]|uniref:DUF6593 domain-containing protein n=1 Tax=Laccaria amethystina LaAM-08-1 TaxID=1095629 RepID=A0A0C9WSL4_9AGAR|nr:hypothetical protein K443DRAFT_109862 [Laccaria amethystina LaAM-08-1]